MKRLALAFGFPVMVAIAYGLWVLTILAFAWATLPYLVDPINLVPPAWLAEVARAIFYRDYVF